MFRWKKNNNYEHFESSNRQSNLRIATKVAMATSERKRKSLVQYIKKKNKRNRKTTNRKFTSEKYNETKAKFIQNRLDTQKQKQKRISKPTQTNNTHTQTQTHTHMP